jgi:hypothetical protein
MDYHKRRTLSVSAMNNDRILPALLNIRCSPGLITA